MINLSLLCLFLFVFLYLLPKKRREKSAKLVSRFQGTTSWLLGTDQISFKKRTFYLSRISQGGGVGIQFGGSYPVLWTYVNEFPKTIVGHAQAKQFTRGRFFVLPPHEDFEVDGRAYFAGSDQKQIVEKIKLFARQSEVSELFSTLFEKPFHHLSISSEIHFFGIRARKVQVLRYVCLPESIYTAPAQLETYLAHIEFVIGYLKIAD